MFTVLFFWTLLLTMGILLCKELSSFWKFQSFCSVSYRKGRCSFSVWNLLLFLNLSGWFSWSYERYSEGYYLNCVILLLLLNLMKGFRLGLFISLNEIIRSILIHLHKVGLFLLLLLLIETTYFIYTSKNDLLMSCCIVWYSLSLRLSLDGLVIAAKGF